MVGALLLILIGGLLSFVWIDTLSAKYPFVNARLLKWLFAYHLLLTFAYYGYAQFNRSDSRSYYRRVLEGFRGEDWFDFYGTSTTFIDFVAYPFIRFGGFSYEAVMVLFSLFGFFGFVYFYLFFKENIRFRHTFLGYELMVIVFFLPNLHFWSASLGKGSIIFLGLGLFFFGISNIQRRVVAAVLGGLIVYHVRPHILLVVLVSTALAFIFSARQTNWFWRVFFLAGASAALFFIYQDVLTLVGFDDDGVIYQGLSLTSRAQELSGATSGVDISQYSLPMQVFTFLYRPLFFDAPGILGLMVSFENVFYLVITLKLVSKWRGFVFLFTSDFLTKTAFVSFLTVSIALAQIAGNLGLAMRQKSQVMILLLFVVMKFMDEVRISENKKIWSRRRQSAALSNSIR